MTTPPQGAVAVDTSVAVPLLVQTHPDYQIVTDWARGRRLVLAGHAVVETYSVLTRLPADMRVAPDDAIDMLSAHFVGRLMVPESHAPRVPETLAAAGICGGATYDGLVALAAIHHDHPLATRDARARSTYQALGVQAITVA